MTEHAETTFEIKAWNEDDYEEFDDGRKLTHARVEKSFEGDLEGRSTMQYLMAYRPDGSAEFVGMERVEGRLGDRSGSFVLRHSGTFEDGTATTAWSVVPGSGTGELEGLRGEGEFASAHAEQYRMPLDYHFD